MRRAIWVALLVATAALALPAAVLALPLRLTGTSMAPTVAAGQQDLFQALLASSQDLGPVPAGSTVSLILLLRDPSARREAADLAAMYDPRSPRYGHFKTAAQYAATYGPAPSAVARVRAILGRAGLTVTWQRGNDWLIVTGPAGRVEQTFRVHIYSYIAPSGVHFYASPQMPVVPITLRREVSQATHISSYVSVERLDIPAGGLKPPDLVNAYDMQPLRSQGIDGSGQTVTFWEVDAFDQKDLDSYTTHNHLPAMHPIVKGDHLTSVEGEADMDIQVVHAIAPGARLVVYYLDMNHLFNSSKNDQQLATQFFGFQDGMISASRGSIFSISLGFCDKVWGAQGLSQIWQSTYDKADQLGETAFASSGDSAAFGCLDYLAKRGTPPSQQTLGVEYPSAAPGVTGVGGTRLSVQQNGSWYNETGWEDPTQTGGTGGGLSSFHARPSWQQGPGVQNQYSNGKREVPDIAATADSVSGAEVVVGGSLNEIGGTSLAAPIWAGMTALLDEYLQKQHLPAVGFFNPVLYHLAATSQPYPPFHDVTVGGNMYYPATPGYDMVTGLGTPDAWNLARDLAAYERSAH